MRENEIGSEFITLIYISWTKPRLFFDKAECLMPHGMCSVLVKAGNFRLSVLRVYTQATDKPELSIGFANVYQDQKIEDYSTQLHM